MLTINLTTHMYMFQSPQVGQLYLSLYSFDAQDTAELSVAKGDTVVLVTPHDQLGSEYIL